MPAKSNVRHYMEELSLLEHLKEDVAGFQNDGKQAPKEVADHIRGMKLVIETAYSWMLPHYQDLYAKPQAEALDFISRF